MLQVFSSSLAFYLFSSGALLGCSGGVYSLVLGVLLRRVNIVKFEFQVDSIRDYGTYSGYENTKKVRLTPATRTFGKGKNS